MAGEKFKFHHQSPAASSTATAMTPSPGWWRKVESITYFKSPSHSSPSWAPRRSGGRAVRGPRRHVSGPPFFGWRIAFFIYYYDMIKHVQPRQSHYAGPAHARAPQGCVRQACLGAATGCRCHCSPMPLLTDATAHRCHCCHCSPLTAPPRTHAVGLCEGIGNTSRGRGCGSGIPV